MSGEHKCEECEKRVGEWLLAYMEGYHGPRSSWNAKTEDLFMERSGLLFLFAQDFRFPKEMASAGWIFRLTSVTRCWSGIPSTSAAHETRCTPCRLSTKQSDCPTRQRPAASIEC